MSVTGNLSASKFIGDGSGLTGLSASSDRITSGTSHIIVSDSTGVTVRTAGSDRLTVTSAGYVGIGTTNPNLSLTVEGAVNLANFRKSGNAWGLLVGVGANYLSGVTNGANGAVALNVNNAPLGFGTNNSVKMLMDGSGNVGIGTTAPESVVDARGISQFVTGPWASSDGVRIDPSGKKVYFRYGNSSWTSTFDFSSTSGLTWGLGSFPALTFGNGNFTFAGSGVGGTSVGTVRTFNVITDSNGTETIIAKLGNRGYTANTAGTLEFANSNAVGAGSVTSRISNRTLTATAGSEASSLEFYTTVAGATAERMRIGTSGNVGIGTTSPAKTLDVSGTARITSATTISGTLQIGGTGDEACTAANIGMSRFNRTTGGIQVCVY